eukprot:3990248-Lingulodinium_polyedra.AAC.1
MEGCIDSCVSKYMELSGVRELRAASTPFLPEVQGTSVAGRPSHHGPVVECPWCRHAFPLTVHESARALNSDLGAQRTSAQS